LRNSESGEQRREEGWRRILIARFPIALKWCDTEPSNRSLTCTCGMRLSILPLRAVRYPKLSRNKMWVMDLESDMEADMLDFGPNVPGRNIESRSMHLGISVSYEV